MKVQLQKQYHLTLLFEEKDILRFANMLNKNLIKEVD